MLIESGTKSLDVYNIQKDTFGQDMREKGKNSIFLLALNILKCSLQIQKLNLEFK